MRTRLAVLLVLLSHHAFAHDSPVPAVIKDMKAEQVGPRIYVVHGPSDFPNPRTGGFINNPGFVLTSKGVVVIDPGSSATIGNELLKRIRAVTDKPVVAVFNTHVHGDHWLGNIAIRKAYPQVPIYAHTRMIERVNAGAGEEWIELLNRMTEGALKDTTVAPPDKGLNGGEVIEFGDVRLRIHHTGPAHTDHDLMIEVVEEQGIFLGDVVTNQHVPSVARPRDANYKGQIDAIRTILKRPAKLFIPGHGRTGGREIPQATLAFLEKLYGLVTKHYKAGMTDYDMKTKIVPELNAYKHWHNFDEIGRVISHMYLQVEADSFR